MLPAVSTLALVLILLALFTGALTLTALMMQRPRTTPLAFAGALVVLAVVIASVTAVQLPAPAAIPLALLAVATAVIGGNPITRRTLELATGGRVHETRDGGILLPARASAGSDADAQALLRGGSTIGYLERLAAALGVLAGFPEALAVIVAVKGIGRFSELATSEARERFLIGTLASLVWASLAAGGVHLALG